MSTPSTAVILTGTEEPAAAPRLLRAGPLTAELDAGNLRHIRYGGVELIRAVSFIVRDPDWGTYNPVIRDLDVRESATGFTVTYSAEAGDGTQTFAYRARIEGTPEAIRFAGEGEGVTDFSTNRTGFVVLHPIDGVAGAPVTIERVDGRVEEGRFPELVDPYQPMMELRALTHRPAAGLLVECRMEGDTYEMEDQRNWTDASYKTYVRPLALPWPYTLKRGETLRQQVTVSVSGEAAADAGGVAADILLGGVGHPFPAVGTGLASEEHAATATHVEPLAALGLCHVVCHHDPRRGDDAESLAEAARLVAAMGAEAWLEAVVVDVDDFAAEVKALGERVAALGDPFTTVLVSPAADMKGTLPGSPWPAAPDAAALYAATRAAFPGARIGGGMFAFFTELNRKRPPTEGLDLVSFTTSALVHAGDDVTVMENLEALSAVAASAAAIAKGTPVAVGPSAIGMRLNPYGAAPMENPDNIRQAMNAADPRQRGLMGAAWAIGHAARLAAGGAVALTFGGTTGERGLVHGGGDVPFHSAGSLYPIYHAVRALAGLAGRNTHALALGAPNRIQAVAAGDEAARELLVANLTPETVTVALPFSGHAAVLDEESFVEASTDPAYLDRLLLLTGGRKLRLEPYAIARVVAG
ncbi:hypothetical protein [Acuticoccus mangrovi]|uniref:Uncharacterized protein n=1 Tax=Acuticoccus mangrovi TaxID=2796142 RepID=A0A934MEA6_9HYPH|nr:hypothetical protein [Acuticoccus mangrovi]MBJ3774178.1 hypothetical protein [Acuticoccus mangrovi]